MSKWIEYKNVEIFEVHKKLDTIFDDYLFKMRIPKEGSVFSDYEEFSISNSDISEKINSVINGSDPISYMSHGMSDIDFYKTANNKFAFTVSPHDGLNIQYVLDKDSVKKLQRVFK